MNAFAYLMIGLGAGVLFACGILALQKFIADRKFKRYIDQMTKEGQQALIEASRETSELTFRDKTGMLCKVRIVVDHALQDNLSPADKERLKGMVNKGDAAFAGGLQDLLGNHKISEDAMGQVEEFIFSVRAVEDMRAQGLEPDDMVRQMLMAAGRIT